MNQAASPIVFFGAGPVALASLQFLHQHFTIEAVITKPGQSKSIPEVVAYCQKQSLPVFMPATKAELAELFHDHKFESPIGVVVDYGIIIPLTVIESFEQGIINSHFSLLPEWRGADPISFAILSGQEQTGVSLMLIVEKLDEGQLLAQEPLAIAPSDTTTTLTDRLVTLSNTMLASILPRYIAGEIKPYPQNRAGVSYSRMLTKADGQLDPSKSAQQLEREVRAYQPWPKSYFTQNDQHIIITHAVVSKEKIHPGELAIKDKKLYFGCKDGSLEILEVQPAGKKPMPAQSFINGYSRLLSI